METLINAVIDITEDYMGLYGRTKDGKVHVEMWACHAANKNIKIKMFS